MVVAFYRALNFRIRVVTLLMIGYAAALVKLFLSGLYGSAPLYLLVVAIVALVLMGRRAGIIATIISVLLATLFAILFSQGILVETELPGGYWGSLFTILMLLVVGTTLLILFYHFRDACSKGDPANKRNCSKHKPCWRSRRKIWSKSSRLVLQSFCRAIKFKLHYTKSPMQPATGRTSRISTVQFIVWWAS